MKKFLTVLLVIAVMFTFSFSSAFAASTDSLQTAENYVNEVLAVAEGTAKLEHADEYSKSAIDAAIAQGKIAASTILSGVIAAIEADTNTYAKGIDDATGMGAFKTEVYNWMTDAAAPRYIGQGSLAAFGDNYDEYFCEVAEKANLKGAKADAKAVLDAIDTTIYSLETETFTVDGVQKDYTYKAYAEKLIADAKDAVDDVESDDTITDFTADTTYVDVINGILYGYDYTDAGTKVVYTKDTLVKDLPQADATKVKAGVIGKLEALETVESQKDKDALNKANLDYAKSILAYEAKVAYYGSVKVEAGEDYTSHPFKNTAGTKIAGVAVNSITKITKAEATAINAALAEKIAKAVEVLEVYLDEYDGSSTYVELVGTFAGRDGFFTDAGFKATIDKTEEARDAYAVIERLAASRKNALLFDGTKMYDDAAIDKALEADRIDVFANYKNLSAATEKNVEKVPAVTDPVAVAIAEAKDKWDDEIDWVGADMTPEADRVYCKDYYVEGAEEDYEFIKAGADIALTDAKTVDEVNKVMADAAAKLAELRLVKDDTAALSTAIGKYKNALRKFAEEQCKLLNKDNTSSPDVYRPASFLDEADEEITTSALEDGFDILDEVKNLEALPAAYEEAKALFKNIKTDEALKKEAAAVVEKIKASNLTTVSAKLENEDAFMEAANAYYDYLDNYGAAQADITGYLVFESKLDTLKGYQQAAVVTAIDDLDDLAPITVEDKAAVEAVRAMLEKYLEFYGVESVTYNGTTDVYGDYNFVVSNYSDDDETINSLVEYEDAVWTAEVNAVEASIKKLTESSTEAEVQAALEAYEALTGSQQRAVKAALGEAFLYKLDIIQKAQVEKVEALKLKASSKATKGAITVKWTVTGDAAAADGYQVWKSTKMNKGYKKAFTTTKTTYKNTKGLKKGVKYYYKVRAYKVVDGKNVYSDWSNKAYRTAQ